MKTLLKANEHSKNFLLKTLIGVAFAFVLIIPLNATKANAQVPVSDQTFGQCIGEELAAYMNALIAAKQSGQIPDNIKLLSPAFNMTSPTFNGIVNGMKDAGANFNGLDGVSGNVYNVGGQNISYYMENVKSAFPGAKIIITETGTFDHSEDGIRDLASELNKLEQDDQIAGALLFNGLGTNGGWDSHDFDPDVIRNQLCGGSCEGKKIGINTATFFSQYSKSESEYYSQAKSVGSNWQLSIADGAQYESARNGISNAIANGMTPIVRIGVGDSSHGFDSPATYASYLAQLAADFPGQDIYAIAGPNEPDLEKWLSPDCYDRIVYTAPACSGPYDFEPVSYRGEVIGLSNGSAPWQLSAALSDVTGENDIDTVADRLTANLKIQTVNVYNHPKFDAVTDNVVGSPGQIDTLVENEDPPFHIKASLKDKPFPNSYNLPEQAYKGETGFGEESYEDWTRRIFTVTNDDGGIRFGTKAEMPATNFIGCLQRPVCDPSKDTCIRTDGNGLCSPGDSPDSCVSVGRLFTFTGEIKHEEPADLLAIMRSRQDAKAILVDERGENRFLSPRDREVFADASSALNGYGLAEANSVEEIQAFNIKSNTPKNQPIANDSREATNIASELLNPTPTNAQPVEGLPGNVDNSLQVSATKNDGNTYNISYRYCVSHSSPCGLGDISSNINGTEIFIWSRSSTPSGTCLEPGWGGAPMFTGVSLPFTVSVSTRGRWVGEEYCRNFESLALSCTVSEDPNNEGQLVSTCGEVPEPPPLDCRDCPSWAPENLCQPIVAPSLNQEVRCANGFCETGENTTIEKVDFDKDDGVKLDFNFSWLPSFITNLIGFYSVSCDVVEEEDAFGFDFFDRIECLFNNKDYLLYAYTPSGFNGDLQQRRSEDLEIHNALFKIEGRTDNYFDQPISSKHTAAFQLGFSDVAARESEGGAPRTDIPFTSLSPDYSDPKDEKFVHLGIKNNAVRSMNVEYYEHFQPQMSGYCLGIAFENFKGEFSPSLYPYCQKYDFIPQGISAGGTPTSSLPPANPGSTPTYEGSIESALQAAASRNGVPLSLLRTILEIEAGPGYSTTSVCQRNAVSATGPFQMIDSTARGLTTPSERNEWNIREWDSDEDFSQDGRCQINIAAELGARLLRQNVGGVDIDSSNTVQIRRAAEGYYGSCKPDSNTNSAFGLNISYCDYVIYKMNLCSELNPSCDEIGASAATSETVLNLLQQNTTADTAAARSGLENYTFMTRSNSDNAVLEENLRTNLTEKDKMQFKITLLNEIERVVKENEAEIAQNNGEIPDYAKNEINNIVADLTDQYREKYNL